VENDPFPGLVQFQVTVIRVSVEELGFC